MKNKVEWLKLEYPIGTRVKLVLMEDEQAPPIGTKGTVKGVDDLGSLLVSWDNGSNLNVVYGVDKCIKIYDELIEQIVKVRNTGLTNMFDTNAVQRIAFEMSLYNLVEFIEENKKEYIKIILNSQK